jgi:cell division protein FtsW
MWFHKNPAAQESEESFNVLAPADKFFTQITTAIIIVGFCFLISASWFESVRYTGSPWIFGLKQGLAVMLGIGTMLLVSTLHYSKLARLAWILAISSFILLLLTAKYGIVTGGSRRWLPLFGVMFVQFSEFTKVCAVILLAKVFSEKKHRFAAITLVIASAALVLKQPDLGTCIIILSSIIFALYANGLNLLLFPLSVALCAVLAYWQVTHTPYQMDRVRYWLHPYSDPLGHGYNLIQSEHAIGSGGLWGRGLGASLQKLGTLPIPHADFIFSIICEEIGFLGASAILLLFLAWILRAWTISFKAQDKFGRLLGIGLTGILGLQVVVNIGVATGLLPVTGMTLPFISFGGSSFISCSIIAGILMNISRFQRPSS